MRINGRVQAEAMMSASIRARMGSRIYVKDRIWVRVGGRARLLIRDERAPSCSSKACAAGT